MVETSKKAAGAKAGLDPELVAAAREVDQSLLRWSLGLSWRERLRACTRLTRTLERFRGATSQSR